MLTYMKNFKIFETINNQELYHKFKYNSNPVLSSINSWTMYEDSVYSNFQNIRASDLDSLTFQGDNISYSVETFQVIATDTTYSAGTLMDLATTTFNVDLSEATEAQLGTGDYLIFLDGGATGTAAKESLDDFADLLAGDAISNFKTVQSFANEDLLVAKYRELLEPINAMTFR